MEKHLVGEINIRTFDPTRDASAVEAIVGRVWFGGIDALMEKQFGVIGGRPWGKWTAQTVLAYLQADEARSFVAVKDGLIVGFCSYVIDAERHCGTVGYNAVDPEQQGQGLGSAMQSFILSCIKAEGMAYAAVIVADNEQHAPARRVYEKHGYRPLLRLDYMVQKL